MKKIDLNDYYYSDESLIVSLEMDGKKPCVFMLDKENGQSAFCLCKSKKQAVHRFFDLVREMVRDNE